MAGPMGAGHRGMYSQTVDAEASADWIEPSRQPHASRVPAVGTHDRILMPPAALVAVGGIEELTLESLILAQDERWRRA